MRILSVIASLAESGGAEMLVRNLSLEYARHGHECQITYLADSAALKLDRDFERGFMDEMDQAGISYSQIGHISRVNPLLGAIRMRRIVHAFQPDIIHVHFAFGLLLCVLLIGMKIPIVYTHHNIVFKFSTRLFVLFNLIVSRYVAICHACRELLTPHVSRPIALIYNGAPSKFAAVRERRKLRQNIVILAVGNLTAQKDYPLLIAAATKVVTHMAEHGRVVQFFIAGEGLERPALEREISARGLADVVTLLGARRDISALMAEADLLVLASRYEGMPISLIEGLMSALPIVATDVGGCAEVVLHGNNGTLVKPGDSNALAEALITLASDEAQYVKASAAARKHSRHFTIETCANAHIELYQQVISRP